MNLFKTVKNIAFANMKYWAAYRFNMMLSIITGPLYFTIQYFIWSAIFTGQDLVNGFTLPEMIRYFGIIAMISYFLWDNVHDHISKYVEKGDFITYLIRPISHRLYEFSEKIGHRLLAFFLEALPVMLILIFVFKVNLMPANFFYAIISLMMAFAMYFLVNYSVGLAAFWMTKVHGFKWFMGFFRDLLSGFFLPLVFFPDILQKILFILPFQYVSYVPTAVWLGKYELANISLTIPQLLLLQFAALIVMYLFTEMLWRLAIKRFTGVGA